MPGDFAIKLRCKSWAHVASIYVRDLRRNALFLKTSKQIPLGTPIDVEMILPSAVSIIFSGKISSHIPKGGLKGRGPGVDIDLGNVPSESILVIENALNEQGQAKKKERQSQVAVLPQEPEEDGQEDVDPIERTVIASMTKELKEIEAKAPLEVLGLSDGSNTKELNKAFASLTKKYHPDQHLKFKSNTIRELAARLYAVAEAAYKELLASLSARAGHDSAQEPGDAPDVQATAEQDSDEISIPQAALSEAPQFASLPDDVHLDLGSGGPIEGALSEPPKPETLGEISDDDFGLDDAVKQATGVTEFEPAPSKIEDELGKADAYVEEGRLDEAKTIYGMWVRKEPSSIRARVGLELLEGLRALDERNKLEAAEHFETVLDLDPTHERAAKELADMKRSASDQRKGLLTRLLGEKE